MTVRLYVRCSTEEQAHSALGLEAQSDLLRSTAYVRFHHDPERQRERKFAEYVDAGYSGATTRRPAYRRMLRDVRRGDIIMFARLDRISRSLVDFGRLVQASTRRGFYLVCLDPDLDLTTPNGELVANVLISVAQWERRMTSQRTKEALAARAARGLPLGSIPRTDPALEARILQMRQTMSLSAIARTLQAEGVPAPRGGDVWHLSTLSRIVKRARRSPVARHRRVA